MQDDEAYKACEDYQVDGEVKKCVSTKQVDPKRKEGVIGVYLLEPSRQTLSPGHWS